MGTCTSKATKTITSGYKGDKIITSKAMSTTYHSNETDQHQRNCIPDSSGCNIHSSSDIREDTVDDRRFEYLWRRMIERAAIKSPCSTPLNDIEQIMNNLQEDSGQENASGVAASNAKPSEPQEQEQAKPDFSRLTLSEIVNDCVQAGADFEAIDIVTQVLIENSATSKSLDLALFCLTTCWNLARKSNTNKQRMIDGRTFESILETMKIFLDVSVSIQMRGCAVLWSLASTTHGRIHITQHGGCEAILNAMVVHTTKDSLHEVAFLALKVLSDDDVGKTIMRTWGASSIIGDIMLKHKLNSKIQTGGHILLDILSRH